MILPVGRSAVWSGGLLAFVVVCAWPWAWVAPAFSGVYSPIVNLFIANETFGHGGHARLIPLPEAVRQATDNVTSDTALSLTVTGFRGDLRAGLSLRRDAYLPLLVLLGLIAAAPLPLTRRLKAISIGVPLMTALNAAALHLMVLWTFSVQMNGVYDSSDTEKLLLDFANGALLTPPGNRFIAPLGIGAALIAWQLRKSPPSKQTPLMTGPSLGGDLSVTQSESLRGNFTAILANGDGGPLPGGTGATNEDLKRNQGGRPASNEPRPA